MENILVTSWGGGRGWGETHSRKLPDNVFLRDLSSQETTRQHSAARIQMLLKNEVRIQPDNIVQPGYRCYLRMKSGDSPTT